MVRSEAQRRSGLKYFTRGNRSKMTASPFDHLPTEVHRAILNFMDISSLAALTVTQRPNENISSFASDEATWYSLIQRRFGIGIPSRKSGSYKEGVVLVRRCSSSSLVDSNRLSSIRKKRPMSYGGSTWKEAYRCLSSTMRIPKTSITSSTIFASPSRYRFQSSGNGTAYSPRAYKTAMDYLGIWCMLNHAENCRTKTVTSGTSTFYNRHRRYLEVKLCLQNTKSGYGCIALPDLRQVRFVTGEEENLQHCSICEGDEYEASFPIVNHGPWAPKILLCKRFNECESDIKDMNINHGIILHPLEFVVISIHLSCPSDMVFETDVLSTLSTIRVQVAPNIGWPQAHYLKDDPGVATAHFLPEELLWEYYSQLPGGYLSLIDRSRLIPL